MVCAAAYGGPRPGTALNHERDRRRDEHARAPARMLPLPVSLRYSLACLDHAWVRLDLFVYSRWVRVAVDMYIIHVVCVLAEDLSLERMLG